MPASLRRDSSGTLAWLDYGQPAAQLIETQETPCRLSHAEASLDGLWVAGQVDCEAGGYVELMDVISGKPAQIPERTGSEQYLLGWGGDHTLLLIGFSQVTDAKLILYTPMSDDLVVPKVPPTIYDAALSPDGRQLVYLTTDGLGHGSKVYLSTMMGEDPRLVLESDYELFATPRWSPDGSRIAFVRYADTSQPFLTGDIVVMDENALISQVAGQVDAGHGFAPAWSPDGQIIAFVRRENATDPAGDLASGALVSNIALVTVIDKTTQSVTAFDQQKVGEPHWSADGQALAFSIDQIGQPDEIWTVDLETRETLQVAVTTGGSEAVWVDEAPDR